MIHRSVKKKTKIYVATNYFHMVIVIPHVGSKSIQLTHFNSNFSELSLARVNTFQGGLKDLS